MDSTLHRGFDGLNSGRHSACYCSFAPMTVIQERDRGPSVAAIAQVPILPAQPHLRRPV